MIKLLIYANTITSFINSIENRKQSMELKRIQQKLAYINDDISWIESNDLQNLYNSFNKTKSKYESELNDMFNNIQSSKILEMKVSDLSKLEGFHSEEIINLFLNHFNDIDYIIGLTREGLSNLFNITGETLNNLMKIIDAINLIKVQHNLDVNSLNYAISQNRSLILQLSEKQLSDRLDELERFSNLTADLNYLSQEVDRRLVDLNISASNTTGVILSDGVFKLSDHLTYNSHPIFEVSDRLTYKRTESASLYAKTSGPFGGLSKPQNFDPAVSGGVTGSRVISGNTYTKLADSPIFTLDSSSLLRSIYGGSGVGLSLDMKKNLLVKDIDPHKTGYLFLKGGGGVELDPNSILVDYVCYYSILADGTNLISSVGLDPSFTFPSNDRFGVRDRLFVATILQHNPNLVIIKIQLVSDYVTRYRSSNLKGAIIKDNAHMQMSLPEIGLGLSKGDLIIRLPKSFLSFESVGFAQ